MKPFLKVNAPFEIIVLKLGVSFTSEQILLFRKKSRSRRLFACKRIHSRLTAGLCYINEFYFFFLLSLTLLISHIISSCDKTFDARTKTRYSTPERKIPIIRFAPESTPASAVEHITARLGKSTNLKTLTRAPVRLKSAKLPKIGVERLLA